jgi:hypothetical protein
LNNIHSLFCFSFVFFQVGSQLFAQNWLQTTILLPILPVCLGPQAFATTPSCWLRWGLTDFLQAGLDSPSLSLHSWNYRHSQPHLIFVHGLIISWTHKAQSRIVRVRKTGSCWPKSTNFQLYGEWVLDTACSMVTAVIY